MIVDDMWSADQISLLVAAKVVEPAEGASGNVAVTGVHWKGQEIFDLYARKKM
jgi:hypothetical protein